MLRIIAQLYKSNSESPSFTVRNNLEQLDFDSLDRGSVGDVTNWGIISNRGSITCIDYDEKFANIYENNEFSDMKVKFFLVNEGKRGEVSQELLNTFLISNAKYDRFTKRIELELSNGFEDWQNKTIDLDLSNYINSSMTLYEIYEIVKDSIYESHLISLSASSSALKLFRSITIYAPYRKEKVSVWSILNEICSLSMCRVIADAEGNPCFYNIFTRLSPTDNIAPNQIFGIDLSENARSTSIKRARVYANNTMYRESSLIGTQKIYLLKSASETYDEFAEAHPLNDSTPKNALFSVARTSVQDPSISNKYSYNFSVRSNGSIPLSANGVVARWINASGTAVTRKKVSSTTEEESTKAFNIVLDGTKNNQVENRVELNFEINKAGEHDSDYSEYLYWDIIEVDFYADMLVQEGTKEVSSGEGQVSEVTLESSPWLQIQSTRQSTQGDQSHAKWLVDSVVGAYSNGVECLEITCTLEQKFERYRRVIPYIKTKDGIVPYSTDKTGVPKEYLVVGQKYSNNGHSTQKIYLQEYNINMDYSPLG